MHHDGRLSVRRDFARALGPILATLLLLALSPSVSAHGNTPHDGTVVESVAGNVTLGPAGTPGAYIHRFGLNGDLGNTLHLLYNVTDPAGASVSFSVHDHAPTGAVHEILNVTQTSFQQDVGIVEAGFYMPQWVNLIASNLTLHYVLYVVRPASIWVYVIDYLWFILPGSIFGLLGLKILWERRKSNRKREENEPDPLEPLLPKFEFK